MNERPAGIFRVIFDSITGVPRKMCALFAVEAVQLTDTLSEC